jgi:hypothetical protein
MLSRSRVRDLDGAGVEIEHRGWESLGSDGETWRERNRSAWGSLLPHYLAYAT